MANLVWLIIVAAGVSGCGVKLPVVIKPARNPQSVSPASLPGNVVYLEGEWTATDMSKIDLVHFRSKPIILIFAQDTCAVCRKGSLAIRDSLPIPGTAPRGINLFTVLVGSPVEDSGDWKQALKIPWTVGADPKSELFRRYCRSPTVPCLLVQLPDRGIVLVKNGEVGLSELTSLTGPWEGP